jgi:23S rRNA pseudouridine955/2504/2580 synthase
VKSDTNKAEKVQLVEVDGNAHGQRVDNFLLSRLKGVPKSRIYRIIRKGEVRVNGKRVKPEYKLQTEDSVRIPPLRLSQHKAPEPSAQLSELLRKAVMFSDQDILVLNKPAGLAVHRGSGIQISVIDALHSLYPGEYLELVHRLDKGTSGCLLLARNARSLKILQDAFRERDTRKEYHALVHGQWPDDLRQVSAGLQRAPEKHGERKVYVSESGKDAATRFHCLAHYANHSLLQVMPVTGRTHQIRVHAAFAGYPLCGDEKYSSTEQRQSLKRLGITRLCLHAAKLSLKHPGDDRALQFEAPYDASFMAAIQILGSLKA